MEPRKALWQALLTVGIPFLVWGLLLRGVGLHADEWLVYVIFVVLPALALFALVYFRYRRGLPEKARLTPRRHRAHAMVSACLAVAFLVLALVNHGTAWRSVPYWVMVVGSLIITGDHLRRPNEARRVVSTES